MRYAALFLFILALVVMQVLVGGAGLIYALPADLLLGLAGLSLLFTQREKSCGSLTFWSGISTLLLAGFVMARACFSPVEYLARWDLFLALGAVLIYFMMARHFVRIGERRIVVVVLFAVAIVHVGIGAIQFKGTDNYMLIPWIVRSDWGWRASGFYIYPNHLAGLLEMLCFPALGFCFWGRVQNWVRVLAGYFALMCITGIALTGSRGGYLSTMFGLAVFSGICLWLGRRLRPDRQRLITVVAILGVAMLVGGALFFMARNASISTRLEMVYDPTNMRLFMWRSALQQFHLSPAIGTGSGTFLHYGRQFRAPEVQADPMFVHNDYLHLLAEYGVVGATLGAAFLGVHIFSGVRGLRKLVNDKSGREWETSNDELALAVGALSGVAALLMHSALDFNFHLPANAMIGALLFSILATPSEEPAPIDEKRRLRGRWLSWLAPVLAVAMLALAVPLLPGEYYCEMARRALRDLRYEESRVLAERAITYERKNPNLYFYLGEARHFLTEHERDPGKLALLHDEAAEAYEQGLRLFPNDIRLLLKLGQTLDLAGRFAEAETIYLRAIDGDPNFGNVYAYYGLHCRLLRRFQDAEFYFHKAKELGEYVISDPALREIEAFKNSELGKTVLPLLPNRQSPPDGNVPPRAP